MHRATRRTLPGAGRSPLPGGEPRGRCRRTPPRRRRGYRGSGREAPRKQATLVKMRAPVRPDSA